MSWSTKQTGRHKRHRARWSFFLSLLLHTIFALVISFSGMLFHQQNRRQDLLDQIEVDIHHLRFHMSRPQRRSQLPNRKQNRKEKFANQSEEEQLAFEAFFEEFEATLDLMSEDYPVLRFKGVEADDIAAHLVKERDQYNLEYIWLISSDRDWDLLIQENVGRFSYVTRKEVTLENWSQHYDVSPEQYISLKCLTGDKGDNVPGIPGIGPKRATSLIKQYGDAMNIYDAAPINSNYKYIQALNENAEQILQNYELMDLIAFCDEAIGADNISAIGSILDAA